MATVLRKDELEVQLKDEHQLIQEGVLRDESPLDVSSEFQKLCDACRLGDLKSCQEAIATGVNINARDLFDYTPLILVCSPKASLCGHYEVVQLLLEAGALCERDTFQGERCLYNALNNRIRNLLLQYDYSKSADPLQPLASHVYSLLLRDKPRTSDISLSASSEVWNLHKFILSARSPYFQKKLMAAPETAIWRLASTIPPEAFDVAVRYVYLGEVPSDLGLSNESTVTADDVLRGIDRVSKQLEMESFWEGLLSGNRRLARQRHQDEVTRGRGQIESWYRNNVLKNKISLDSSRASDVKWTRENGIFADVLLRADEVPEELTSGQGTPKTTNTSERLNGIPIGPSENLSSYSPLDRPRQSVLFPVHRAMLLRSEYFQTMFTSAFQEAQLTDYLNIINVDCSPRVLQIVLDYLYTEKAHIPIELALDVLFAADMLFIEKLKTRATVVICTIGNGTVTVKDHLSGENVETESINIYDVIRAGWDLKVQRLEEFGGRYLAQRLEDYIDDEDFEKLIMESAERIENRQETDTIELLDDIRHFLSERFRLRFVDSGLDDIMDEDAEHGEIDAGEAHPTTQTLATESDSIPAAQSLSRDALKDGKQDPVIDQGLHGAIRTLDGNIAGDEFAADAVNYQILLEKIDRLLERLNLDA